MVKRKGSKSKAGRLAARQREVNELTANTCPIMRCSAEAEVSAAIKGSLMDFLMDKSQPVPKEVHQATRPPGHHAEQCRVVDISEAANLLSLPRRIIKETQRILKARNFVALKKA